MGSLDLHNQPILVFWPTTTHPMRSKWVGNRVTEWDAVNHPIAWGGAELLGKKNKHGKNGWANVGKHA